MFVFIILMLMGNGTVDIMKSKAPFTTLEDCTAFGQEKFAEAVKKLESFPGHGVIEMKAFCKPVEAGDPA